jgi:threonine dehydratase
LSFWICRFLFDDDRRRWGGAAAFAAVASGRYQPQPGERLGILVSGGNTIAVDFDR